MATHGPRIAVIPAGEQWHGSSLRPCLEDLIGAGAVLEALNGRMSPEAEMAVATFKRFRRDLRGTPSQCGSGKELIGRGFELDIELAAEHAVSSVSPVLVHGRFIDPAAAGFPIDPH
jgi:2-phosphosulfolactate phosphatase